MEENTVPDEKAKIIKRYANRRLYDSDTSKTITLEDVADFIKQGYNVKVVDNITQQDITSKILGQVFLKVNLEGLNSEFNTYLLTSLIREGSRNIQDLFRKLVQSGLGAASLTQTRIEKMVEEMVREGHLKAAERIDYINDLFKNAAVEAEKLRDTVNQKATEILKFESKDPLESLNRKVLELANAIREIKEEKSSQPENSEKKDN